MNLVTEARNRLVGGITQARVDTLFGIFDDPFLPLMPRIKAFEAAANAAAKLGAAGATGPGGGGSLTLRVMVGPGVTPAVGVELTVDK